MVGVVAGAECDLGEVAVGGAVAGAVRAVGGECDLIDVHSGAAAVVVVVVASVSTMASRKAFGGISAECRAVWWHGRPVGVVVGVAAGQVRPSGRTGGSIGRGRWRRQTPPVAGSIHYPLAGNKSPAPSGAGIHPLSGGSPLPKGQ